MYVLFLSKVEPSLGVVKPDGWVPFFFNCYLFVWSGGTHLLQNKKVLYEVDLVGPTCCRWRKFLARPLGRTAPRWVLVPGDEDHLRIVDKFRGKDELCTFYSVLLITEITPSARSTLSFAPFALIQQMLFLFVFFHYSSQQKLISKDQKWNTGPLAASQLIFPRAQSTRPFLPEKWELLKQYERGSTYFELEGWWKNGPLDLHIA